MKGRKPKPNGLKEAEGSRRVRPEPKYAAGVGAPPSHLDANGKREWRRIATQLEANGVLQQTDRTVLAAYCAAYAQWLAAERLIRKEGLTAKARSGATVLHPGVRIKNESLKILRGYMAELGLTPATRQQMPHSAPLPDADDDEFFGPMRMAG